MKKKLFVLLLFFLALPGYLTEHPSRDIPNHEMIIFAPSGKLSPEVFGRLTKNQKAGDLLTVVELTDEGPKRVGTRSKGARLTAKEAQSAGSDQRRIAEFVCKSAFLSKDMPRMDLPAIFRVASEVRKTNLPLDVVVMGSPIHTAEGAWDCSKGYWISDGCITQPGTPFSQTYENLNNSTFWFIPNGWPWGNGDQNEVHEQAWIRVTQLFAVKHGAKLGAVSPDTEAMARNIEERDVKLEVAILSDEENVVLYQSQKWNLVSSE